MGINGLWDVLGEGEIWHIADYAAAHFKEHKRPLRNAIDEATWRFTNLTPEQIVKIRDGEPAANPQEKVILWRILRQWRLNIQFLFVTDGMKKPWKASRHKTRPGGGKMDEQCTGLEASRHKTRPGGGKMDEQCIKLLHQLFDLMKVHHHRAPGEGDAECARLQQLGIVDAVWSDDCDAFMFGCTTLIKQHKVAGKRVEDHIRVYRASTILERLDFDADSFVLFALLAGGDYDATGLRGCGEKTAKEVVTRKLGLATRIKSLEKKDLPAWRASLAKELFNCGKPLEVPHDFPKWKALEGYRAPSVSTDEQCRNLRALRRGWDLDIDQRKLRIELRHRYNFSTREYLKHLAPAFLAQKLARTTSSAQREENAIFGVQLKPIRVKKTADPDAPARSEVRILCSPAELVEIDLSERPPEENWEKFAAKDGTPYDPFQKLQCHILDCLLQNGLPQSVLAMPLESAKRSKSRASDKAFQNTPDPASQTDASDGHSPAGSPLEPESKKRGRPPKDSSDRPKPSKKKQKVDENIEARVSPPPRKFKRLDIPELVKRKPDCVDLDGDDESWTDLTETGAMPTTTKPLAVPATSSSHSYAGKRSFYSSSSSLSTAATSKFVSSRPPAVVADPQELSRAATSGYHRAEEAQGPSGSHRPAMLASPLGSSTAEELVPGEGISLAALRELRLAAFTLKNSVPRVTPSESSLKNPGQADEASQPPSKLFTRPLSKPSSKQSFQTEVIDLT